MAGYNDRLFKGGVRARVHFARFHVLQRVLQELRLTPERVIELGCFDGKTLRFLPKWPVKYLGLDADWENGLDIARRDWANHPECRFVKCESPDDWPTDEKFDFGVCMETLEHVPVDMLDGYVAKLAGSIRGHLFVTVPTEKGLVFAVKFLAKKWFVGDPHPYTLGEFVDATLGRMDRIPRDQHKGFDYQQVVDAIARHFEILSVRPYPVRWLPRSLGFGVAIVARSRS